MQAGAGNVFGFWADLQVEKPFVVHSKRLEDLTENQRQQYRIMPFHVKTTEQRERQKRGEFSPESRPTPLMYMKWPGGGQIASFQFVNGLIVKKKDEFSPNLDLDDLREFSHMTKDTEFVATYNYIDNFVYAEKLQNGPFIETHPFPHVFVPQIGIGKGRVIVGTVADKTGRYNDDEMEKFAAAMRKPTEAEDKVCGECMVACPALPCKEECDDKCRGEYIGYIKILEIEVDY